MVLSDRVFRQYESIRRLGQTNMLDEAFVQQIAAKNDFHALVAAIEEGNYTEILKNYSKRIKDIDESEIPVARGIKFEVKLR